MIRGQVRNGVVVLEAQGTLREGTEVAVEPLPQAPKKGTRASGQPSAGRWRDLPARRRTFPPDAPRNLDHYLYGHAKR